MSVQKLASRWYRYGAMITAAALCSGLSVLQARAQTAGCAVRYTLSSSWGTGFSAAIEITNTGPAVTSWTLQYAYTGNQTLTQGWNGNWSQSGQTVTVTNASWNGSLATQGSAQIGANFSYSGSNPAPASFTLNGTTCGGPAASPSPSPSPSPTATAATPSPSPTTAAQGT